MHCEYPIGPGAVCGAPSFTTRCPLHVDTNVTLAQVVPTDLDASLPLGASNASPTKSAQGGMLVINYGQNPQAVIDAFRTDTDPDCAQLSMLVLHLHEKTRLVPNYVAREWSAVEFLAAKIAERLRRSNAELNALKVALPASSDPSVETVEMVVPNTFNGTREEEPA